MISLDTEVNGVDLYHGARPFFLTICKEDESTLWWEWEVNPLTREVTIPREDSYEIRHAIREADSIVMQNGKFDVTAMVQAGIYSAR
jgi:hypothetical protein